jgi:protease I
MADILGTKVAIVATHGFEQSELEIPRDRLKAAGAEVDVVALETGEIRGWDHKDWGHSVPVDRTIDEISAGDYDALVLPGGQINPDLLRIDRRVLDLIRAMHERKKIVAAVCHAPWLLIESGLAKGLKATSYKSIKTDMVNAGANASFMVGMSGIEGERMLVVTARARTVPTRIFSVCTGTPSIIMAIRPVSRSGIAAPVPR